MKIFNIQINSLLLVASLWPGALLAAVCDIDADGDIDRDDIAQIMLSLNTVAGGPDDPMDADGDGFVTVIDARACVLACTLPRCVIPPVGVSANFDSLTGILTVTGTPGDDLISISRTAGGDILVNGGAVPVSGGTPTVGNTTQIVVDALAGNDDVDLDEADGPLPSADLNGGPGDDVLVGGSGSDQFDGGDGNDLMIWNNGDGSDFMNGGEGNDTVRFNGDDIAADDFWIVPAGGLVRFQDNFAESEVDIASSENLEVNGLGGNDAISAFAGIASLILVDIDGGAGDDVVNGGDGDDLLRGGDGVDTLDGNDGEDTLFGGDGGDFMSGGDDNDELFGEEGDDVLDGGSGADFCDGGPGENRLFNCNP